MWGCQILGSRLAGTHGSGWMDGDGKGLLVLLLSLFLLVGDIGVADMVVGLVQWEILVVFGMLIRVLSSKSIW